jgi:hypothetical protein
MALSATRTSLCPGAARAARARAARARAARAARAFAARPARERGIAGAMPPVTPLR